MDGSSSFIQSAALLSIDLDERPALKEGGLFH